jgi:hypothetical protein
MKLEEMEALKADEPESTRFTITHLSTIIDDKTGDLVTHAQTFPYADPDFHLGAVGE